MKQILNAATLLIGFSMTMAADTIPNDSREVVHSKDKPHIVPFDYADKSSWETRADFLRKQTLVAMGLFPMPEKTPLNPVIHGDIDRDTYTIKKVFFQSLPGHYVSGNLYVPKNIKGKVPAVLAPYGHWPDGRFWWRSDEGIAKEIKSGAEKVEVAARSPLQANCANLAKMGCIVFQYDMVGYCDSTKIKHREGFLDAQSILRNQSFMGLQTWNSIRSLDFVLSLPEVDPTRIGCTGSSSGGSQTIALDAVDPRVAVAVPMAMVSMNMQGGCVCENAPLYRVHTNNTELASLFAPKPQGMACGNDWTIDFLTRGLPEMKSIWKLYGVETDVYAEHYNFGHNHNLHSRELQYNFFNKHFKLGLPEPVAEQKFEIVPVKELSVYDDNQPLPADAIDAEGVKKWMEQQSDSALKGLNDADFAQTIQSALKAMVVDDLPAADQVESELAVTASLTSSRGTISRKGAGERVPAGLFNPMIKSDRIIIWVQGSDDQAKEMWDQLVKDHKQKVFTVQPFRAVLSFENPRPTAVATTGRSNPNPAYEGYNLGYNRSILAEQVHDILTAITVARSQAGAKSISMIASGNTAPAALIAAAIAGDKVDKVAIDLGGFDFDQITSDTDPRMLPGALKYGGLMSFASLRTSENTRLFNAAPNATPVRNGPRPESGSIADPSVVEWLSK